MATLKQKLVVAKIIENHGNVSKSMRQVGYSKNTAKVPSKNLTDTKGFKEVLASYGLTEDLVTTALVFDIKSKPKRRFNELSLGAEILGMKKRGEPEKDTTPHTTNIVIITPNGSKNDNL